MLPPADAPSGPGREALALLGSEPARATLGALGRLGPLRPAELERQMIARSSLHRQLRRLERVGLIGARQPAGRARATEYELRVGGRELLGLAGLVEGWLAVGAGDEGPRSPAAAWRAAATLGEGWATALTRCLAVRPLSRAEVAAAFLPTVTQDALRGRLDRLVFAGICERRDGADGTTRYGLTEWGRRGVGVLAAASSWEASHLPGGCIPATVADGIAGLYATLPLVRLPPAAAGVCDLAVLPDPGAAADRAVRFWVDLRGGRAVACGTGRAPGQPLAWVQGTISAWMRCVVEGRPAALQRGGETPLATALLRQLHEQLLGYLSHPPAPMGTGGWGADV